MAKSATIPRPTPIHPPSGPLSNDPIGTKTVAISHRKATGLCQHHVGIPRFVLQFYGMLQNSSMDVVGMTREDCAVCGRCLR